MALCGHAKKKGKKKSKKEGKNEFEKADGHPDFPPPFWPYVLRFLLKGAPFSTTVIASKNSCAWMI